MEDLLDGKWVEILLSTTWELELAREEVLYLDAELKKAREENDNLKKVLAGERRGQVSINRKLTQKQKQAKADADTIRYWKQMYRLTRTALEQELMAVFLESTFEGSFETYARDYFLRNKLVLSKPKFLSHDEYHDHRPFPPKGTPCD